MGENIITIPLTIEDEERKLIKKDQLVLSIIQDGDFRVLKGVIPEGIFTTKITIKQWQECQIVKGEKDFNWITLMNKLLPEDNNIDPDELFKTNRMNEDPEDTIYDNVGLYAKFTMSKDSYEEGVLKEDFQLVNDFITVNIQTNEELSRTYGSLKLNEVDEELDLFLWVQQLANVKNQLLRKITEINKLNYKIQFENEEYKTSIDELILNNKLITEDLVNNFAAILHSKKKHIAELQNKGNLEGLNKKMKERNGIRLDNIVIDDRLLKELPRSELPSRKRKQQTKKGHTKKPKKGSYLVNNEIEFKKSSSDAADVNSGDLTEADVTNVTDGTDFSDDESLKGNNSQMLTDHDIIKGVVGPSDIKKEDDQISDSKTVEGNSEVVNDSLTDYSESESDGED